MTIYILGTFFVQITLGMNPYITAQGCSRTAMISTLIGAVLNIVLDPLFIFVLHMGIKGAALATVISQFVSAVWVFYIHCDEQRPSEIWRGSVCGNFDYYAEYYAVCQHSGQWIYTGSPAHFKL